MTEISGAEIPPLKSALAYELEAAESESSLENQAYLAAMTIHDLYNGSSKSSDQDGKTGIDTYRYFRTPDDGKDYLQAGVPHPGKNVYEVGELPYDAKNAMSMYDLRGKEIIRIPQCHMLQMQKDKNPYLYLTMSTCSACIGYTEKDVFVAHVGLSERGGMEAFINQMRLLGVTAENMYAVASVGTIPTHLQGAKTDAFDFSRIETVGEVEAMGIPPDHIQTFTYASEVDDTPNNLAGVVVTPGYIASYQCDYLAPEGKIVGGMRNFKVIETNSTQE